MRDINLNETLPKLPPSLDGVSVADIPLKYFDLKKNIYPAAGFCIDAYPHEFNQMLKNARSTPEHQYDFWKQKVEEVFTPQPTSEKTFISLCVRSTFDNYF